MADESMQVEATQPTVESAAADATTVEAPAAEAPATEATNTTDSAPAEETSANTDVAKADDATAAEAKTETAEATTDEGAKKGEDEEQKKSTTEDGSKKEDSETAMLKTTRRTYTNSRQSNVLFDPSVLPDTDDPVQIRSQVEFYFADQNLCSDEFLWKLTGGTENKPVDLKKICSFKRMRRFKPYEAVVKALRESNFLEITGEDGSELVARKSPYDPSKRKDVMQRSVYVKGFGDEQPSTQFDIEAFFAKFDTVKAIRLRRTQDGLFKGSVFAEFETQPQAEAFLALDPAPKWKGHDLKIMSKQAYVDEKNELIAAGKLQPTEYKPFFEGSGGRGEKKGRGGFRGGRGGWGNKDRASDPNDWKARKAEDRNGGGRGRGGRGRGGRGRGGRGGRGGNRDNRDRRDRDDDNNNKGDNENAAEPTKRARDEDGASEERPAKKVDAKAADGATEGAAE